MRHALIFALALLPAAGTVSLTASSPVVQILTPDSGVKLHRGQAVPVTIQVQGAAGVTWSLTLAQAADTPTTIASGTGTVQGAIVARIVPASLVAGAPYTLTLAATGATGATASAVATFSVPDRQYTLIPLEEGNLSQRGYRTYAVDEPGNQIIYSSANGDPAPITLLDRRTGKRDVLLVRLNSNEGFKFSGDGSRLFFTGSFRHDFYFLDGLGYLDLHSRKDTLIVQYASFFFSVDESGRRVAYQAELQDSTSQYFLYDEEAQEFRQLTSDPAAIVSGDCPSQFGATPLITADGGTVVMITSATLGIVPPDPAVGCRIFSYDVAAGTFKQIAALPRSLLQVDTPALSGDGRWLSFAAIHTLPTGGSRGIAALMDMQTGVLSAPVVNVGDFTTFDSAVTRDGAGVVISTQADLDPRVGNADHNLELFYFDRVTQQVSQISETRGGIGSTPHSCGPYAPSVSRDGGVLATAFARISVEGCNLDGPQRNEADGFAFGFVRAVRKRPGNADVVLDAVPDQRVVAGDTVTIDLTAHDPDGDPISFFAQAKDGEDVPPGSTITDHHDGTATFAWPTRPADTGDYVLRVAAFDEGGGEMFQDVTISVVPHAASSCTGDCNGDQQVTVDELVTGVGIAMGTAPVTACPAYNSAAAVTVADLVTAVNNALDGCASPTAVQ
jgi:hypothetical protein